MKIENNTLGGTGRLMIRDSTSVVVTNCVQKCVVQYRVVGMFNREGGWNIVEPRNEDPKKNDRGLFDNSGKRSGFRVTPCWEGFTNGCSRAVFPVAQRKEIKQKGRVMGS